MHLINIIDTNLYNIIIKMFSQNVTAIMTFIAYLGSAITLITFSLEFIFLFKNKKYPIFIILNLISVFILNRILKLIIARPRPQVLILALENGYSFPSGHAMVSFGFYGFLIYLAYKNIKNKKIKYPLIVFLSILILLIGISRVYLGVHYATDVIGGFAIGFIYLVFFVKFYKYCFNFSTVSS
ncbi:MAG: phosphatase PAP2 family protein [Clostridia bacterium]|nr:phosphatase PAP2 family protein [Clostridia bacterium]